MKLTKDLSWLSAPAFFLIIGMLIVTAIKQNDKATSEINRVPESKSVVQK